MSAAGGLSGRRGCARVSPRVTSVLLLVAAIALRSASPAVFKAAALRLPEFSVPALAGSWLFLLGLLVVFARSFLWQALLRGLPLAWAHPFMSLCYVAMLALGLLLFDEPITLGELGGTVLIVAGIVTLATVRPARADSAAP